MDSAKLFERYSKKCPFALLTQMALRWFIQEECDKLFHDHRSAQYENVVLFSALANAVADVTLGFAENFNQAYKQHKHNLAVSTTSFYDKINATELPITQALVRQSALRAAELQDAMGFQPREILPGYQLFSLDGNHFQESDKRLGVLRNAFDAPLAGTMVARFDHQRELFDRAYPLADAHAQESTTHEEVLRDLRTRDVLIADRHHCVLAFFEAIEQAGAFFVIRQHGRFKGVLIGQRKRIGRTRTGVVYEQEIRTSTAPDAQRMRRITVELDKPTRDGDRAIHVLTNLPATVCALTIAEVYRMRWEEETGFFYLTTTLTCEVQSVSHPQAALFLFGMAMMAFNVRQTILAALHAEHERQEVEEVSHFQISVEVARYTDGMLVVLDDGAWQEQVVMEVEFIATFMRKVAKTIDLKRYRKSRRGPKKKKVIEYPGRARTHLSTGKALREAKARRP